jgi:hypothetical protein
MRGRARQFAAWTADSFRLAFSFLYWNAKKHAYVRRGRTGRCPCQNPSDDSVPGRVRCQAVLFYAQPARFATVCPLLVRTEHGWCCSVRDRDVRPFWGRAAGRLAAAAVIGYVALVLATFAFLRGSVGLPVSPLQIAWPGRWREIPLAQAELFYRRAMTAFQAGQLNEAFLALSSARERDPRHYEAGLLLAQITMFQGSFLFSDELFQRLFVEQPERAGATALVYHDTLLALNRMDRLAELSLQSGLADEAHAARWNRSLLFALRSGRVPAAFFEVARTTLAQLPPHARLLVDAEREILQGRPAVAREALRAPFRGPLNAIYMRWQVERLASLGAPAEAQALLDFYGPVMGDYEHALAQLELDVGAGDAWNAAATLRQILATVQTPAQLQRLAAMLIEVPDAVRFRAVHERVLAEPKLQDQATVAALWAAALACGAPAEARFWAGEAAARLREKFPALARIDFASRDIADPAGVLNIVNAVTLPRETVVALLGRMHAARLP